MGEMMDILKQLLLFRGFEVVAGAVFAGLVLLGYFIFDRLKK